MPPAYGRTFTDLYHSQAAWSDKTFGHGRSPAGPLRHLLKEAKEAIDECGDHRPAASFQKEIADCFLLVIEAARLGGMMASDLLEAAWEKHKLNTLRKWGPVQEDGVVEHTEEPEQPEETSGPYLVQLYDSLVVGALPACHAHKPEANPDHTATKAHALALACMAARPQALKALAEIVEK